MTAMLPTSAADFLPRAKNPTAILRVGDADRETAYRQFVADLKIAAAHLERRAAARTKEKGR